MPPGLATLAQGRNACCGVLAADTAACWTTGEYSLGEAIRAGAEDCRITPLGVTRATGAPRLTPPGEEENRLGHIPGGVPGTCAPPGD